MNKIFIRIPVYSFFGLLFHLSFFTALMADVPGQRELQAGSTKEIHLNLELNSDDLLTVFRKIERMTDFNFVYNDQDIDRNLKLKLSYQNTSLYDILMDISKNAKLAFKRVNSNINVRKLEEGQQRVAEEIAAIRISGKVTAQSDGQGLPGVNVLVKDSSIGTVTDVEGNYSIEAGSEDDVLIFSFIGYLTLEEPINGREEIDVALAEDVQSLDEVVVTAFGLERKKEGLAYSVTEVEGQEFTQARETNVANALTGKIAGVNATSMASGPGSSSRVVIRGNGSLNGNNQPLYVINGMPISNSPRTILDQANGATTDLGDGISSINPDDIESISVLKGGAAAALYGSQAANGVILITTKQGARRDNGVGIELNSNFTIGTINVFPDYQYEYGQGSLGVRPQNQGEAISTGRLSFGERMDGEPYVQFDGVERPYSPVYVKDNIKNFYRPSTNLVNTVALTGGNESILYRFSVSDLRSQAIVEGSRYNRQTANLNFKAFLSEKLSFNTQIQYNFEKGINRPGVGYVGTNSAWGVYLLANTVDIRDLAPGYDPETGQETEWQHVNQATNPYFARDRMGNSDKENRVIAQASMTYDILPNLFIKGDFMRDFSNWSSEDYYPVGTAFRPLGTYRALGEERTRTNARLIVNYNTPLFENFNFSAMAGGNLERNENATNSLIGSEFIVPDWISHTNLAISVGDKALFRSGTNSVFASADFDYNETIYLSVTGRQDWFSTLNPGNNNIFYPSIGGSVVLSNLIQLPKAISFAKIRGSWAEVGSATVDPYAINQLYGFRPGGHLGVPVQTSSSQLSNPDLRPLTSTTTEIGIDAQFFDNRFGLDFTLYQRINTDDIVSTSIAPSSGATSTLLNVGEISNKGVELLLTGMPIKTPDFSWNISYNLGYNKNRVISLAPGQATGASSLLGKDSSTRFGRGYSYTEDGTKIYNSISRYAQLGPVMPIGIGVPPYTMGLENTFAYKNFSLNVLVDAKFGNDFFSQNKQYMWRFGLLKETLPGRDNGLTYSGVDENGDAFTQTWPASFMSTYYNNDGQYATNFMIDGSFVKLRSLILNYNIPVEG